MIDQNEYQKPLVVFIICLSYGHGTMKNATLIRLHASRNNCIAHEARRWALLVHTLNARKQQRERREMQYTDSNHNCVRSHFYY